MSDNKGPLLAAVTSVFLGFAVLFVSLRCYVKAFLTKNWAADDALLLISLIFFILFCVGSILGVSYGTGQHLTDINTNNIPSALRLWFLGELWYTLTTCFVRLAIAVFLFRLATKTAHKMIIYVAIAVNILISVAFFFLALFQCRPVGFFWTQYTGAEGKCFGDNVIPSASIAHSVVSFCVDWVLGFLPFAILYELEMKRRTKISVGLLLSMGLLQIHKLAITDDWLYKTVNVAIWSTVEPGLGIMAIAGATFRPLFRSFLYTTHGTQTDTITYHTHNNTQLAQYRKSTMNFKRAPSTATDPSILSYTPTPYQDRLTPTPTPQQRDGVMRSPVSATFDFAAEDRTHTMTSMRSCPFSDRNEVRTPTSPTFAFRNTTSTPHETFDPGSRSWNPSPSPIPQIDDDIGRTTTSSSFPLRNTTRTHHVILDPVTRAQKLPPSSSTRIDGITVERTVRIHEDEYDETPEGFLGSEIESIGLGSVSSRPSTRDGRSPSDHRTGRKDSMTIIREDGMVSRTEVSPGMRAEWDVVTPGTANSEASSVMPGTAGGEVGGGREGSSFDIARTEGDASPGRVCPMDAFI